MPRPDIPLLLEPEQLADLIAGAAEPVLVDVSSPENYRNGHIPGALHLHPGNLQGGVAPAPGKLPGRQQLAEIFSYLGLSPEQHVIAYDDEGGGWAGRLLWTLEVVGHPHYSYLNGGIHAWRDAGLDIETQTNQASPSDYPISLNPGPIAEVEDILPRLGDPDFQVWDARSAPEYRGERSGSRRAGHIPGAINIDWLELIDRDNATRLVDLKQLRRRLDQLGLSADKEIVTYCQTHHRSSLSWLVMKILAYPSIKGYHGSWGEWGNRDDTPIEV
ncbi:MAG: rhodanese-like domain-containing protein [Gammaproteobacteria bacterium]|nr:rhodanese-like domain-containing protein [Gammaproteobacteria bacterium]